MQVTDNTFMKPVRLCLMKQVLSVHSLLSSRQFVFHTFVLIHHFLWVELWHQFGQNVWISDIFPEMSPLLLLLIGLIGHMYSPFWFPKSQSDSTTGGQKLHCNSWGASSHFIIFFCLLVSFLMLLTQKSISVRHIEGMSHFLKCTPQREEREQKEAHQRSCERE